jgi:hypothetical protein
MSNGSDGTKGTKGRISVGPKKTLAELAAATGRLSPEPNVSGQPAQVYDKEEEIEHWKYHHHLDASWDNAPWAERHDNNDPNSPYYGDPFFSREGKKQNDELREAIVEAFVRCKKIDPNNPQWLLAWRMYPNEEHPRWSRSGYEGCGCNCGCFAPYPKKDKK